MIATSTGSKNKKSCKSVSKTLKKKKEIMDVDLQENQKKLVTFRGYQKIDDMVCVKTFNVFYKY